MVISEERIPRETTVTRERSMSASSPRGSGKVDDKDAGEERQPRFRTGSVNKQSPEPKERKVSKSPSRRRAQVSCPVVFGFQQEIAYM